MKGEASCDLSVRDVVWTLKNAIQIKPNTSNSNLGGNNTNYESLGDTVRTCEFYKLAIQGKNIVLCREQIGNVIQINAMFVST
jgi:hypothetical protein